VEGGRRFGGDRDLRVRVRSGCRVTGERSVAASLGGVVGASACGPRGSRACASRCPALPPASLLERGRLIACDRGGGRVARPFSPAISAKPLAERAGWHGGWLRPRIYSEDASSHRDSQTAEQIPLLSGSLAKPHAHEARVAERPLIRPRSSRLAGGRAGLTPAGLRTVKAGV
jgi:hypothetical protein